MNQKREPIVLDKLTHSLFVKKLFLCTRRAQALQYAHKPGILIKETPLISLLLYKWKKGVSIDTEYKRKWCVSFNWHPYYNVNFFVCQPLFWIFLTTKRQSIWLPLGIFFIFADCSGIYYTNPYLSAHLLYITERISSNLKYAIKLIAYSQLHMTSRLKYLKVSDYIDLFT